VPTSLRPVFVMLLVPNITVAGIAEFDKRPVRGGLYGVAGPGPPASQTCWAGSRRAGNGNRVGVRPPAMAHGGVQPEPQ
jgi:hypothetical protein